MLRLGADLGRKPSAFARGMPGLYVQGTLELENYHSTICNVSSGRTRSPSFRRHMGTSMTMRMRLIGTTLNWTFAPGISRNHGGLLCIVAKSFCFSQEHLAQTVFEKSRIQRVSCKVGQSEVVIWNFHHEKLSSGNLRRAEMQLERDRKQSARSPDRFITHIGGDFNITFD